MLAPTHDFGYSPAASHHQHHSGGGYEQHHHAQQQQQLHSMVQPHHHQHHSGERPKLFALDTHLPHGMHALVHHDNGEFNHLVHGTPQQHHHHSHQDMATPHHGQHQQHHAGASGNDFDNEPLMMSLHQQQHHHANAAHYYAPMGHQLLHVSTDYPPPPASAANSTPSASTSGTKRSREDLNMKEKKRMFKLNDRINQLKDMLDDAGVACKKSKQSILDNTVHYISMLRSNLLIAQQKAERAEKQAEVFRSQAQQQQPHSVGGSANADIVFKRCFNQSSTARLVTDVALQPLTYNHAFAHHTGLSPQELHQRELLRQFLCNDAAKLDRIVETTIEGRKATSTIVQARTMHGDDATLTLVASPITDDVGNTVSIEFSLVPFAISSPVSTSAIVSPVPSSASTMSSTSFHSEVTKRETHEASPSGIADLAV